MPIIIRLIIVVVAIFTMSACATRSQEAMMEEYQKNMSALYLGNHGYRSWNRDVLKEREQNIKIRTKALDIEERKLYVEEQHLKNEQRAYEIALRRKKVKDERERVRLMRLCRIKEDSGACLELKKRFPKSAKEDTEKGRVRDQRGGL